MGKYYGGLILMNKENTIDRISEKRNNTRHKIFWTIIQKNPQDKRINALGYLLNISETGINIWIDKNQNFDDKDFNIILQPPDGIEFEPIDMNVHQVWTKIHEDDSLIEMGCSFNELNDVQRNKIQELAKHENKRLVLKGAIMMDS